MGESTPLNGEQQVAKLRAQFGALTLGKGIVEARLAGAPCPGCACHCGDGKPCPGCTAACGECNVQGGALD